MTNTITFDPNRTDSEPHPWGIWFADHRLGNHGRFKIYKGRGAALNAFSDDNDIVLWELTPSGWIERIRREAATTPETCERCGRKRDSNDNWKQRVRWRYVRRNGKILDPLAQRYLCYDCDRLENY